MNTYLISTKSKFQAIITHFNEDIQTLRTGRATPALVENIIVDYASDPSEEIYASHHSDKIEEENSCIIA